MPAKSCPDSPTPQFSVRLLPTLLILLLLAGAAPSFAAGKDKGSDAEEEKPKWDVATSNLGPTQKLEWTVDEGTWISLDVSPDGSTIVMDLLGDLFTLPIGGGKATPLRTGRSYDLQPRFSPDGDWISFTSDAGGGDNIWVMRKDGTDARQVTDESFRLLNNAVWMPDGQTLVARKHFTSGRSLGAGEMWLYDVNDGGSGIQLTEKPTEQKDVGEPEISPDGRYVYYSLDASPGSTFQYNKDPNGTIYQIRRLDLETGRTETTVSEPGGSVRPELSPDGKQLAYVRRVRNQSVLMVRDLETGQDRMLFDNLYPDQQETWAIFGVYPGFAWTPDGKSIVIWGKGKLHRIGTDDGSVAAIPFQADLSHEIVDAIRFPPEIGRDKIAVQNIRWPRLSPTGSQVVFQALGRLWIRESDDAEPRPLTGRDDFEFHPRWSADGSRIVFTTWDDVKGGHVITVNASGGDRRVVVETPGHYAEPAFSQDGGWIVYRRAGGDFYRGSHFSTETGIYVVEAQGGEPRRVTRQGNHPRFWDDDERLMLLDYGETKTLYTVDLLGGDRRELASSERASEIVPSPDGKWLAFAELWEVYVTRFPAAGKAVSVGPEMKNLPVHKVSDISGEYLDWSADGKTLRYGLGENIFRVDVPKLFQAKPKDKSASSKTSGKKNSKKKKDAEEKPESVAVATKLGWDHPADIPSTDVVLVGGTVLTMDGDRIVEDGAVRIQGNRIVAVGSRESVDTAGAKIIDVSGKTLVPGYVDIHAHTFSSSDGIHARTNWAYLANLAFGVTTTHDPSNSTGMIHSAREMVQTGRQLGPRLYSTGTILYGAEGDFKAPIESAEDAERHLKRLKAYGAFSVKSYNQPRRNQRQWVLQKARDVGMMVVPEGGSTFHHNMTMFLDGHTTLEHAIPLAPLYEDVLHLVSKSGTAYTPTLVVGYGGLWGENYWYQKTDVWKNERLLNFVPRSVVDPRSRRRTMVPDDEFHHIEVAKAAAEIVRRGGIAEVGAHGQMQGLGVHWEMWMFHQGGLDPMDVLRVGTIFGAKSLGLDRELGSIEVGKLADLLILSRDPRDDIRNTAAVEKVIVNGRMFDAETMDQLEPEAKPRPLGPELNSIPRETWGPGCLGSVH